MYFDSDFETFEGLFDAFKDDNNNEEPIDHSRIDVPLMSDCDLDLSDDIISVSSDSEVAIRPKAKRKPYKKRTFQEYVHVPKPRVLKFDVRKNYSEMFVHCLNDSKINLMYGFIETYFRAEFLLKTVKNPHETTKPTTGVTLSGIPLMIKFWRGLFSFGPDTCVRVTDSTIHVQSGTERAKVVCKFVFQSTRMYAFSTDLLKNDEIKSVTANEKSEDYYHIKSEESSLSDLTDHAETHSRATVTHIEQLQHTIDEWTANFPPVADPEQMNITGTLTMFTDEQKNICGMEMETNGNTWYFLK